MRVKPKHLSAIVLAVAVLGLFFLWTKNEPEKVTLAAPKETADAIPTQVRVQRHLMGTAWQIQIYKPTDEHAALKAGESALDEVARLEHILSEWDPESDLSKLNTNAGLEPFPVTNELFDNLDLSKRVSSWSDRSFDVTWAVLRGVWDFSPQSQHRVPDAATIKAKLPLWNDAHLLLDEHKRTAQLKKSGMAIGLGGIAKGYAIDQAAKVLRQHGFQNFLIFGGGQVYGAGNKDGTKWRVGIQHPRDLSRYFAFVEIENESLATSGDYEHFFERDGVRYHHIIDPKTGYPSTASTSVTVISSSAFVADAIDTALFIMGHEKGLARLQGAPSPSTGPNATLEAIYVDNQLRIKTGAGTQKRLVFRAHIGPDGSIGDPL